MKQLLTSRFLIKIGAGAYGTSFLLSAHDILGVVLQCTAIITFTLYVVMLDLESLEQKWIDKKMRVKKISTALKSKLTRCKNTIVSLIQR